MNYNEFVSEYYFYGCAVSFVIWLIFIAIVAKNCSDFQFSSGFPFLVFASFLVIVLMWPVFTLFGIPALAFAYITYRWCKYWHGDR